MESYGLVKLDLLGNRSLAVVRDGLRLSADVYRPNRPGPFPTILEHLPYRKDDSRVAADRANGSFLASRGLALVRLDVRGTGNSAGVAADEYTLAEQLDGVDAVEWIAAREWCNGNVGSWGVSYGGFSAIQLACHRPPALKAIAAVYATDDRYTDDMHFAGGALCALELAHYPLRILAMNALPPSPEPGEPGDAFTERWLDRVRDTPPWVIRWLEEQHDGPYWRNGSARPDYDRIECPVLLVAGWRDGYRYTQENIARLRSYLGRPDAPIHFAGGVGGSALKAWDVGGMVKAVQEAGVLGASVYDWLVTDPSYWQYLWGVRNVADPRFVAVLAPPVPPPTTTTVATTVPGGTAAPTTAPVGPDTGGNANITVIATVPPGQ